MIFIDFTFLNPFLGMLYINIYYIHIYIYYITLYVFEIEGFTRPCWILLVKNLGFEHIGRRSD